MSFVNPVKSLLLERNAAPAAAMLYEFHTVYGLAAHFDDAAFRDKALRESLLVEEVNEVLFALEQHDLVNLAKELADLIYVIYGMALTFGFDLDAVLREVHRSNMSKLGEDGNPIRRDDGKILKGPNYSEASIHELLF